MEQRLATFGLRRGPYGLTSKTRSFKENRIERLRAALETLGPVFCSFGSYLSTRVDLLTANDCLELATLPDGAEESSWAAISVLISQELGYPLEDVYLAFEERPFTSGQFHQQHHAWLANGQPVVVKVIHPEAEEFLHYDVRLLQLLKGALIGKSWTETQFESAIEDFHATLQQRTDFWRKQERLEPSRKTLKHLGC